jgi:hypothetical protein
MRTSLIASLALAILAVHAAAQESQIGSDLRREGEHVGESCSTLNVKAIGGCVYTLATDYPFHVAFGSLAPGNGTAFGVAFAERYTPNESWRLSWSADAVRAISGSYRAGAYMKIVRTPPLDIVVAPAGAPARDTGPREVPVIDLFTQTTWLRTLGYFGEGPDTASQDRSLFGERQTMFGGSIVYPLSGWAAFDALRVSVTGGVTGRFIDIRPRSGGDAPSIDERFILTRPPGFIRDDAFVELREGVRIHPSVAGGHLQLAYAATAQQFRTDQTAHSSFNRWTVDLQHGIPFYRTSAPADARELNTPNQCSVATGSPACPRVSASRNRQGAVNLRLLMIASTASAGNTVPFYLQPTLGGSDLNGERLLAGYDDYRFRAPSLLLAQESVEHSLWGPIGVFVMLEQGVVSLRAGDFDTGGVKHSVTAGLTLRAGGFPIVNLSVARSPEGHHVIAAISPSLLGGGGRPRLF